MSTSGATESIPPPAILVVDDNPSNLHLMSGVLREGGYTVRAVPDGKLALEAVRKRPPDLILLDIKMPDMDGFEVCRRLKADPASRDIPVIFLSALHESKDKLNGFAVGAVDYITKPFVAEEVLVRVRTHLTLRELQLRLERKVGERTRALRTLSAANRAVVHAQNPAELLALMSLAIVEQGGYHAVWIGCAGDTAYSYSRDGAEDRSDCEHAARAMPMPDAPALFVTRRHATQNIIGPLDGEGSCDSEIVLALPLQGENLPCDVLVVFAGDGKDFSAADDVDLLHEMSGDLGYGLQTLQAQEENLKNRYALERSLEQTIEAIAATIEVRDPYTAGHQRRTTRIAVAIGQEMGLDADRLKGLQVAGTIHDIGKISVPVEILSRPGKLSDLEFNVIKHHSEAGHDIVQGIDFPWPVAQIIRQHHERMDGAGYPDGLRGEAILLESRILAVADVVEAISSHRPYRPGLGVGVAIEELKRQRGGSYDADAVDSALRLYESGELERILSH
jgi:response regulator RpfG family c-di-GMP phosphodiesterase